jgi:predicted DNA-binding transcriptional regulator AlpA
VKRTAAAQKQCYRIDEFCAAHGISRRTYYRLREEGTGPQEIHVGDHVLITAESAARWRAELDAAELVQARAARKKASVR